MSGCELLPVSACVTQSTFPWSEVWEGLKVVAEFGLLVFAGTQVWLQGRDRRDRQRTALAVVFADRSRLQTRLLDWEREDLVAAARAGKFFYDGIAPPDWGVVVRSLGELGPEAAALGSVAYALLNQAIRSARLLAETNGQGVPGASGTDLEKNCKEVLGEVLKTLDDALGSVPAGISQTQFTLTKPVSMAGQHIAEALARRRQAQAATGFWATRTGRVLSALGRLFPP